MAGGLCFDEDTTVKNVRQAVAQGLDRPELIKRFAAVGMALVDAPLAEEGTPLQIFEDGCRGVLKLAHVVPMPFYDPGGERMRM